MNPLEILLHQWPVWIAHLLGFLLLYYALSKWFFAPLAAHITRRQEEFDVAGRDIEDRKDGIEQMTRDYAERIAKADREAYHRTQELVKEALARRTEMVSEAHAQMVAKVEEARAVIRRERDEALVALSPQIAALAVDQVARFAHATLDRAAATLEAKRILEHLDEPEPADESADPGEATGSSGPAPQSDTKKKKKKKKH